MNRIIRLSTLLIGSVLLFSCTPKDRTVAFGDGSLQITPLQDNAARIRYIEGAMQELPELVYTQPVKTPKHKFISTPDSTVIRMKEMTIVIDGNAKTVAARDAQGRSVFMATSHQMQEATREATLTLESPQDEFIYGLGQFQDGYLNVKGLTRRLTQVNTQISIPMIISSKGYGLLGTTTA